MSDIIKVGVVGAGGNTVLKHIPLLQKIEGVEIVSVANRSIKSSSAVASQFEIKNYYDNWIEVVHDPGLDAIVIGTWPYMHKKLTIEALEQGKHVLCEARMDEDYLSGANIESIITGKKITDCEEAAGATRIKRLRDSLGNQIVSELLIRNVSGKGYMLSIDKSVIEII